MFSRCGCLRHLCCDICMALHRYIPVKGNPEGRSITELEFRHAVENRKPCLIFLLSEDHPWPRSLMEKGEAGNLLQALRAELSTDYTVSFFGAKEDLARLVSVAVNTYIQGQLRQPYSSASRSEPNSRFVSIQAMRPQQADRRVQKLFYIQYESSSRCSAGISGSRRRKRVPRQFGRTTRSCGDQTSYGKEVG